MKREGGIALVIGKSFDERLAKMKKEKEGKYSSDSSVGNDPDQDTDEYTLLSEEMMDAADEGDSEAFSTALKQFVKACLEE